ncbi:MAG: c-type cytochrome [Chloroflexi bacterium]|nr:c-type cytochrome [Chloroflexota bacterium]
MQQKMLIGLIMTLIIVGFIPVYWAMEPKRQEAALQRQQAEAAARGAHQYTSICAACHGAQGEGSVGPALKGNQMDDADMRKIIVRGVAGTAMVAWGKEDGGPLNQEQIKDLVIFIKNWDSSLLPTPAPPPVSSPPGTSTSIDAKKLFATNCAMCHGQTRQGTPNLAPALTPASLEKFGDTDVIDVISEGRPGTAMSGFKDRLSSEEIDALANFIKHTPP